MRAIRLHEFGPAENLRSETVADPVPGDGQVRIAVKAGGVHLIETWLRGGTPVGPHPLPQLPITPGGEVAGIVDALGPGADEALLGKRVVASLDGDGGYAELAVAEASAVHEIPEGLDFGAAVAMVTTGTTALSILEIAELRSSDVVVVTAAAGGIGALLVQAARGIGATVVAAAGGARKVVRAGELGAQLAIDYNVDGWTGTVAEKLNGRRVTVVLDGVGGETALAAYGLLSDGGRVVSFGAASDGGDVPMSASELESRGIAFQSLFTAPIMAELQDPAAARNLQHRALESAVDELKPVVQTFPLADAAAAHRALESRQTMGKVVLVTD